MQGKFSEYQHKLVAYLQTICKAENANKTYNLLNIDGVSAYEFKKEKFI